MSKLIKNNWNEYNHNNDVNLLSWLTRFMWFCDYGNNPELWWHIYVGNKNKNDYGTWWYNFKRSKFFWCIVLIIILKLLYPTLPILSLINIVR